LSAPRYYRARFTETGDAAISIYADATFQQRGFKVDGPFYGTTLRAGREESYPVARFTIEAPGTYRISDVTFRYAEPDGSTRSQLFHIDYVIGTNGGSGT
jgi:hypothetical protein